MGARRLISRALVFTVSTVAFALIVEGVHRLVLRAEGRQHRPSVVHARFDDAADLAGAFDAASDRSKEKDRRGSSFVLHPFTGGERRHDTGDVLASFRSGLPSDAFVVLVVGGSVAQGYGNHRDPSGTHTLERALSALPGLQERTVRVLNYAHAAYKQPQQLMRVAYLLRLGHRPHLVLNIDGYNEIAATARDAQLGLHPAYPSPNLWSFWVSTRTDPANADRIADLRALAERKKRFRDDFLGWDLEYSSVLSSLGLGYLERLDAESRSLRFGLEQELARERDPQGLGPSPPKSLEEVLELSIDLWFESAISLHAICEARGIPYLHVLQPALAHEGAKELSREEQDLLPDTRGQEAIRLGYPRLRERLDELRERGVLVLDATQVFAQHEETLYRDPVHQLPTGKALLATAIDTFGRDAVRALSSPGSRPSRRGSR